MYNLTPSIPAPSIPASRLPGAATVILVVGDGKRTARGVDRYLASAR